MFLIGDIVKHQNTNDHYIVNGINEDANEYEMVKLKKGYDINDFGNRKVPVADLLEGIAKQSFDAPLEFVESI